MRHYDRGEKRLDHKWGADKAGFESFGKRIKGKCPTTITNKPGLAEQLLNEGVPYPDKESPEAIYNVHEGVIYRAEQTLASDDSWHGFPEMEEGKRRVPREVLTSLMKSAITSGHHKEFRDWMESKLPVTWKNNKFSGEFRKAMMARGKQS
ncbi:MAG: hypothetical protein HQL98_15160 [Magnetococcales bacterium]|nr:hypothetical protein [Magnetococcales bacterium]